MSTLRPSSGLMFVHLVDVCGPFAICQALSRPQGPRDGQERQDPYSSGAQVLVEETDKQGSRRWSQKLGRNKMQTVESAAHFTNIPFTWALSRAAKQAAVVHILVRPWLAVS